MIPAPYTHEADILHLITRFRERTLPIEEWTHHAHLLVALWHVREYGALASVCLLRGLIISYNTIVGTPNTTERGYHETLTLFWIAIIDQWLNKRATTEEESHDLLTVCNDFLTSKHATRELPLQYYKREDLFSIHARALWLVPTEQAWNYTFSEKIG